jgi:hypothetical protein
MSIDMNLRTYNTDLNFLNLATATMRVFQDNLQILEVKHSAPLPSHLQLVLGKTVASRNSISKFVLGQRYNEKSSYRDPVHEPF